MGDIQFYNRGRMDKGYDKNGGKYQEQYG